MQGENKCGISIEAIIKATSWYEAMFSNDRDGGKNSWERLGKGTEDKEN